MIKASGVKYFSVFLLFFVGCTSITVNGSGTIEDHEGLSIETSEETK